MTNLMKRRKISVREDWNGGAVGVPFRQLVQFGFTLGYTFKGRNIIPSPYTHFLYMTPDRAEKFAQKIKEAARKARKLKKKNT